MNVHWSIKPGLEERFKAAQQELAQVMLQHPGVLSYPADYPKPGVSEWVELYANNDTFAAHLDNPKGHVPLSVLVECCRAISCRCWGTPNNESGERLKAFTATYPTSGSESFVLNPHADLKSSM